MSNRIAFYFIGGLVTVVVDGNPFDVEPKHPKYKEIIDLLKRKVPTPQAEDIKAKQLLAALKADSLDLRAIAETIGWEDVKVDHGVVTVKGQPMRNSLTQRILDLQAAGLPYDSFVRFLVNLQANPSEESREALYDFVEQGRFPRTAPSTRRWSIATAASSTWRLAIATRCLVIRWTTTATPRVVLVSTSEPSATPRVSVES
jgi:hypothetical protein